MKRLVLCIYFVVNVLLFSSCYRQQKKEGAKNYADTVISMQEKTVTQADSFFQSLYYQEYDTKEYYKKALFVNRESLQQLKQVGVYRKADNLFQLSKDFHLTVDDILQKDGVHLMRLYDSVQGDFDSSLKEELDSILKRAVGEITEKRVELDSALSVFLEYYKYEVEIKYEERDENERNM